jgi:peroxiredoxin
MEALHRRFKDRGLEILAVNYAESQGDVAAFMSTNKLSFPTAVDISGKINAVYGITAIPTTYIIDRNGAIISRIVGSLNWNTPKVLAAFDTLLNVPL